MGKMTFMMSDEVEEELRDYIRLHNKKPFGKMSSFIEEAVKAKLEEEKTK